MLQDRENNKNDFWLFKSRDLVLPSKIKELIKK